MLWCCIEVQDKKIRFSSVTTGILLNTFIVFQEEESLQAVEYYREYFFWKASMKMKFIRDSGNIVFSQTSW